MKNKLRVIAFCISLLYPSLLIIGQSLVIVQQSENSVAIYDVRTGKLKYQLPVGFKPHEVACDNETRLCYISDFGVEDYDTRLGIPGRSITVVDPTNGKVASTLYTTTDSVGNMPHGIKVRPEHHELYVNVERKDSMLIFDSKSLKLVKSFPLPALTHNFIFSQNGKRLWLMCGASGVIEIDPSNGIIVRSQKTPSPVRGLTWINSDLLASCNNELLILSSTDLSVRKHFGNFSVGQLFYSAVSRDQKTIIAPAAYDSTVLLVDAANGHIIKRIITPKTPLQVEVSGNMAYITHPLDDRVTVIDIRKRNIAGYLPIKGANGITIVKAMSR